MTVSKKQQDCVNRYVKRHYDRINVTFKKGYKEQIQAAAALHGLSVNAYIVRAVSECVTRDLNAAETL